MSNLNAKADTEAATLSQYRLLIDGQWVDGDGGPIAVLDKYRLAPFALAAAASPAQITHMIDRAHAAFRRGAPTAFERGAILERAAGLVEKRADDFVATMQAEAGFTVSDASNEVRRCVQTLKLSGEEARRLVGEVVPVDGAPRQAGGNLRRTPWRCTGSRCGSPPMEPAHPIVSPRGRGRRGTSSPDDLLARRRIGSGGSFARCGVDRMISMV